MISAYSIDIQNFNKGGNMDRFKGLDVCNEYKGDLVRQWRNTGTRKVDDIFGPYHPYQQVMLRDQEDYLRALDVPFITTTQDSGYRIWKEQKAEHIR
jgi:hypothetical protein